MLAHFSAHTHIYCLSIFYGGDAKPHTVSFIFYLAFPTSSLKRLKALSVYFSGGHSVILYIKTGISDTSMAQSVNKVNKTVLSAKSLYVKKST